MFGVAGISTGTSRTLGVRDATASSARLLVGVLVLALLAWPMAAPLADSSQHPPAALSVNGDGRPCTTAPCGLPSDQLIALPPAADHDDFGDRLDFSPQAHQQSPLLTASEPGRHAGRFAYRLGLLTRSMHNKGSRQVSLLVGWVDLFES